MSVGLLGKKVGMTQVYDGEGNILPVTVIEAGPCVVLQVRTLDRDGYEAVQVGFDDHLSENDRARKPEERLRSRATRPARGHVANIRSKRAKARQEAGVELLPKADCEPKKFIREFRTDGEDAQVSVGDVLTVERFAEVERVDVVGTSKGRGFAGAMKRHNFGGQPASHGAKKVHRHIGGTGGHAMNRGTSGFIKKGKRMPGRYGHDRRTVRNLKVVRVDPENNLLLVRGAVPGPNGGYVMVRQTNKLG